MKLVLLDRDGVVVVNRATNVKSASDLDLIDGAAEGIRRLNEAGFPVAICTNQPEVASGVISEARLCEIHTALGAMVEEGGGAIDRFFSCTSALKCPRRKPSAGLLREALKHYGARAEATPFIGDQADDLKAAFHARCPRMLVRTGLGAKAMGTGLPDYLRPYTVCHDLLEATARIVKGEF
jgi:D-glycero-D-manno-heptose 1,7-bisphosphate phosphatase